MDGATFVALTGTIHREDEPSHISIIDPSQCVTCETEYANACTSFCPGQVYRWSGREIVLSPSNCLHCMTCTVKCPTLNIRWVAARGRRGSALQAALRVRDQPGAGGSAAPKPGSPKPPYA